jgi:anti-sigma factor RsiW
MIVYIQKEHQARRFAPNPAITIRLRLVRREREATIQQRSWASLPLVAALLLSLGAPSSPSGIEPSAGAGAPASSRPLKRQIRSGRAVKSEALKMGTQPREGPATGGSGGSFRPDRGGSCRCSPEIEGWRLVSLVAGKKK